MEQSASESPRDRGGGRHPGLRDDGVLRGTPSERRPRSVRPSEVGLLPSRRTHRRQRMSRGRRGRERRPHALFEAHAPGARRFASLVRPSTRPSLGPLTRAPRSPLQLRRGNPRRWRIRIGFAVGQTRRKPGGTDTEDGASERCAARRVYTAPQGGCVARQKRKDVTASVPARMRELGAECSFVVAVAEIGRRRLVSNKLVKRAPKRAARGEWTGT